MSDSTAPVQRLFSWLSCRIVSMSWHKHWKGVYIHCISIKYTYRLYLWGIDRHLKPKYRLVNMPANANDHQAVPAPVHRLVGRIREVARLGGWAIGIHGSVARDIDLIAVPWTENAVSCETLVSLIVNEIGYTTQGQPITKPRPGGRRSILIFHPQARRLDPPDAKGHWDPMVIDLALFPPNAKDHPYKPAQEKQNDHRTDY